MNKELKTILAVAVTAVMGIMSPSTVLAADFVTKQHGVTVAVPEVLSISADTTNFTLSFPGYVVAGSETDTKTVTYTVQSNNMRQIDGATAINANLDALLPHSIDFLADVGAYTKTSGNTELAESASGFVKMVVANTAIAKKANTPATSDGKILNGTIPITYKAKANGEVPTGSYGNQLFVTLTTI